MRSIIKYPVFIVLILGLFCASAHAEDFELLDSDFEFAPISADVVGDFNDWTTGTHVMNSTANGFSLSIPLSDGQYAYKFFVTFEDGAQTLVLDPASSLFMADDQGGVSSLLALQAGVRVIPDG